MAVGGCTAVPMGSSMCAASASAPRRSTAFSLTSRRSARRWRSSSRPRRRRAARVVITDGDRLRRELQSVCERVLGVSPIGWSDDLLGFGADSLAVMNLLLEIEGYAGHPLPLSALLSEPSIEGVATALSVGAQMTAAPRARTSFQTMTRAKYHAADILLWLLKSRQRAAAGQAGSANLHEHVPIPAKQREV